MFIYKYKMFNKPGQRNLTRLLITGPHSSISIGGLSLTTVLTYGAYYRLNENQLILQCCPSPCRNLMANLCLPDGGHPEPVSRGKPKVSTSFPRHFRCMGSKNYTFLNFTRVLNLSIKWKFSPAEYTSFMG
jgi:hypothetical protein